MPLLYTYPEVAASLKCQVRHVRILVASGALPYVLIGKRARRIPAEGLKAFLADRTRGNKPAQVTRLPVRRAAREDILDVSAWRTG